MPKIPLPVVPFVPVIQLNGCNTPCSDYKNKDECNKHDSRCQWDAKKTPPSCEPKQD